MPRNTVAPTASTLRLPSDTEIELVRSFAAPRELVWRAWTDAKLLPKWMGHAAYKLTITEMDVREGGNYRWTWDLPPTGLTIYGTFVEVDAPRRIVTDEYMEPSELRHPSRNVTTFAEKDGRTTVSILLKLPTKEARDAALATGMTDGLDVSYARLDSILAELG